ncbi:TPA: hypothetical protein ACKLV4_002184, partial [Neisseria gonorrhoeae]
MLPSASRIVNSRFSTGFGPIPSASYLIVVFHSPLSPAINLATSDAMAVMFFETPFDVLYPD